MAVERFYNIPKTDVEQPNEKVTTRRAIGITRIEAIVYITLISTIAILAIIMLTLKTDAYAMQTSIDQTETEIATKEREIDELTTEVTHLSSYERIYEKANALGLDLNNSNIKVVEKNGEN